MKYILILLLLISSAPGAEMAKKWASTKNCEACHQKIAKTWESSRHANSHFSKNDLYKKSIEYMVAKNPEFLLDEMKVKCAKCHNPRVAKSMISDSDKILLALEDEDITEELKATLNTEQMKNGINCVVCHNIEEIHLDKSIGSQGLDGVKFGKQGMMFGPFKDSKSPHHESAYKEHFAQDSPTLCFTCHYSYTNGNGLEVYSTGKEYEASGSKEGCRSCHMSEKKEGVASEFAAPGEKPLKRMVRDHYFASVDNSRILHDNITVQTSKKEQNWEINVSNNAPHALPTGYGLREIRITAYFLNASQKEITREVKTLTTLWHDRNGKPALPFTAVKKVKESKIAAKSSQIYSFKIPKGAMSAKYTITYRFINQEMAKTIGISDPFFLKEYKIQEGVMTF